MDINKKTEVTGEWSPNHFVPCYDKQSIEETLNTTAIYTQKQHTLPSNVPRANKSSPLTSSGAQVQYACGKDTSSSTDTKLPECKMAISMSTKVDQPQLLKSTATKSMVMALSKIRSQRKSFPTNLHLALKVNEKESASLFDFCSASKSQTTIPTENSENKASTSKPVYSQLTTSPSPSSALKSKSMVMALSKIHSKRKSEPTKLNLVNEESTSLFDFYSASELITLASVNKDNTDISTPMCITPSAISTSMAITHSSADHAAIPKNQSTSTEHAFTVQSARANVTPSTSTQLITHMETTSSVTTTRNLLKAIATITSKQSKSNKASTRNTKPITSYFSTQDHSNDIIHGVHPKVQVPEHVLSYNDSDNEQLENEFTYIYSKSDTENDSESDSDSSNSDSSEISMEIPTTVVQTAANILPFTAVSTGWYVLQSRLAKHNLTRDTIHQAITVETDDDGLICYVNRSEVQGTLQKNIADLQMRITSASQAKRNHLEAILLVGKHFLSTGPLISTQELGAIYMRQKGLTRRYDSVALYDIFCKHLNISQIYLFGRGYAVQNNDNLSVCSVVTSIKKVFDTHREDLLTEVAAERLSDIFRPALQYMDTPRDKQVLKGLISEMTNIDFTTRLRGIQNRRSTRRAKCKLPILLGQYKDICKTSQIVRNDLTVLQQHQLTQRVISQRKLKEIRIIAQGRGRKLKCSEFPELATVLSYAFGEYDMQQGGGGLEAHPRLTNGTLYQTTESVTTMKRAREILFSMAPKGFTISLSTCYNYTENYRERSAQAKRHHAGRGINALISLGKPPRTGVEQLVINLHWSTANVNLNVDAYQDLSHCIVVSKDAKAIIPGDISPVQRPGRSWKPREHPDHTWDQSRVNAITPMTFLFLSTVVKRQPSSTLQEFDLSTSDCTTLHLTRTGQGVTLINLSFYEPETTFRCITELLYLLTLSSLDCFFRDQKSGSLKKEFIFVVDNGPSEQPSSPLVQMVLVRLVRLLNLDKVTQVSFAEYHSKRNYVERVHAEENHVLSSHGPFSSKVPNKQATPGTPEHKQNMESMAEEVKKCIAKGSFCGNQLLAFRGVECADFVFNDQEELQRFLDVSEDNKELFSPESYSAAQNAILDNLHFIWGANRPFTGKYLHDYRALGNDLIDGTRTAWLDKYTTSVYSTDENSNCRRHELQPLPDYLRWFKTNELHYLPLEERCLLNGDWDDIPGVYLPTKVGDLCLSVIPKPDDTLIHQIALLSWVTPREVKDYISKQENQYDNQIKSEMQRRRWKVHPLYKNNNREKLAGMCRSMHIPVTSALAKHDLAKLICETKGEPCPPDYTQPLYHGKLSAVPCTTSAINKLTIHELRAILKHHGYSTIGTKDQLILRVFMLRHNKRVGITAREEEQLKDLVQLTYKLIYEQRKLSLNSHIYRKRTYTLQTVKPHFVPLPNHVSCEQDLKLLFQAFIDHINKEQSKREEEDKTYPPIPNKGSPGADLPTDEQFKQVGAKIKVQWSNTEVAGTGWRPGWFTATVQQYCEETDMLLIKYSAEQGQLYEEELTPLISSNKIKLISSPL